MVETYFEIREKGLSIMPEDHDEKLRTEYDSWEADYEDDADEHSAAWLDDDYDDADEHSAAWLDDDYDDADDAALLKDKLDSDYESTSNYLKRMDAEMRSLFPQGKYKSISQIDYTVYSNDPEVRKKLKTATGLLRDAATTCSGLSADDAQKKEKTAAVNALAAYIGYHCALKLSWDGKKDANEKFYDVWGDVYVYVLKHLKDYINDDKGKGSFRQYIYSLTNWRYINIKKRFKEHPTNAPEFVYNDAYGNDIIPRLADDVGRIEILFRRRQEIEEAMEFCLHSKDPKYQISQDEYDIIAYTMGAAEGGPEQLSSEEIAQKINKSYDYVRKHFRYAAGNLRKFILKKFYN